MSDLRTILSCPKCAALVAFEHTMSNIKECTCGHVLLRSDAGLLVQDDLKTATVKGHHIKPGTTGSWTGKTFTVTGKMGVWFEESYFCYWFIVFISGETGLLAEGYGMYSVLLPDKDPVIKNTDLSVNKIGQVATLTDYQLQKKNTSYYWEVEGELSLVNFSANMDVYEYANRGGDMYTIFRWAKGVSDAYRNNPVKLKSLDLKHTRDENPFGKELKCPSCRNAIKIKTYPLAQSCTCNSCGTFYAIEMHQPVKTGNNKNNLFEPLLPLGTRGVLKGIDYEVVGYTQKEEKTAYKSKWKEYVLYNSQNGFAFLTEYDGHWIYLKETIVCPVVFNDNTKEFTFEKRTYNLFNAYTYKVIEAKGEFPYNLFDNGSTQVKEYIDPPFIWIREKDNREGITWFYGEHIGIGEISDTFTITAAKPSRRGIGAVQPTGYLGLQKLVTSTLVAIVVLVIIHFALMMNRQSKVLAEGRFFFADTAEKVTVVTEKFELEKWRSHLAVEISAPVSNNWFELEATLVNTATGKELSVQKGVEYYSGYAEGEFWTEGSRDETAYITNIPAGNYFLQLEGTRENFALSKLNSFSVKAVYDGVLMRNFWCAALLMLIWPLLNFIFTGQKERSRWGNSAYSNYKKE